MNKVFETKAKIIDLENNIKDKKKLLLSESRNLYENRRKLMLLLREKNKIIDKLFHDDKEIDNTLINEILSLRKKLNLQRQIVYSETENCEQLEIKKECIILQSELGQLKKDLEFLLKKGAEKLIKK